MNWNWIDKDALQAAAEAALVFAADGIPAAVVIVDGELEVIPSAAILHTVLPEGASSLTPAALASIISISAGNQARSLTD